MELSAHDISVGKQIAMLCYERYASGNEQEDHYWSGKVESIAESNDLEFILSMLDTSNRETWLKLVLALHQESPARIHLLAWVIQFDALAHMLRDLGVSNWTRGESWMR